ncbi:hypothetical protein V483_4058, partial [Bordetella pertussis CHLA-11]
MNWGGGDFQFLKSGSDEPCIQPIESSQLEGVAAGVPRRPGPLEVVAAQPARHVDRLA